MFSTCTRKLQGEEAGGGEPVQPLQISMCLVGECPLDTLPPPELRGPRCIGPLVRVVIPRAHPEGRITVKILSCAWVCVSHFLTSLSRANHQQQRIGFAARFHP